MRRSEIALSIALLASGSVLASAQDKMQTTNAVSCAVPFDGVIRFALVSDTKTSQLYDWTMDHYRFTETSAVGAALEVQFPKGSFYRWNTWGPDVGAVSRSAGGPESLLSSPYGVSPNGKWLAAGLMRTLDTNSAPTAFAVLRVDTSAIEKIVQLYGELESISWAPGSDAIVVMTRQETYVKKSLRQRFSAAIGHPIPYADIGLTVYGLDGSMRCTISPAKMLAYGTGYTRWDRQ